jgi:hypothetical protein
MGVFGIVLPGGLAPASDILIVVFIINLAYMGWLLNARRVLLREERDLLDSPDWSAELEKGWKIKDKEPDLSPTIDAFAEVPEDEDDVDDLGGVAPEGALPPRANCAACAKRLVEADMWAKCLGCGSHYHTICLGRLGACASCNNPVEGLELEEESSKSEAEDDEA